MGMSDHLTCLLRNLYAGQEATVRTGHATTDWFRIGKGVHQGCILSPCLFNFYAEYILRNTGLEETQAGIKIAGRISITSDMQMTPPLWQWRKWRRTKKPLDESERGEWKSWLKAQHSENEGHGIWSHHLWEIDGETVETVADLYFFCTPKSLQMVTAAMKLKDAYSLEQKLWRRHHIKKQTLCCWQRSI